MPVNPGLYFEQPFGGQLGIGESFEQPFGGQLGIGEEESTAWWLTIEVAE